VSQPQKIAIIAGQLVVGGAERQIYLWLKYMDRSRFSPVVITLHPGHHDHWETPIKALDIPLIEIPQSLNRVSRLKSITDSLRPYHPELIHGWHLFSGAYAGLAGKFLRCKSIGGLRSSFSGHEHSPEAILTRLFCDAVIVNSSTGAKAYQAHAPRRQKIFAVRNAVSQEFIARSEARAELEQQYHLPQDAFWIGSIGRADPLKRFDLLLSILPALKAKQSSVHLVLIGDGPELPRLREQAESSGLTSSVTFTGELPDAGRYLKAFDLFCLPSTSEGMPNVILEAAAAGLPIVTWDLPFYQEILENGKTGLLVEAGNEEKLEEAVTRLIESPQLRAQLGVEAQARILREFSLERYIRSMTAAYDELLNNPPAGASGNP